MAQGRSETHKAMGAARVGATEAAAATRMIAVEVRILTVVGVIGMGLVGS